MRTTASRNCAGVAGGDEPSGVTVNDDLAGRAARADAWPAGPHRFDEHEPEPFVAARHHKRGAACVLAAHRFVVQPAEKDDVGAKRERRRLWPRDAADRRRRRRCAAPRPGRRRRPPARSRGGRRVPCSARRPPSVRQSALTADRRRPSTAPGIASTPGWQTSIARPAKCGLTVEEALAGELRDRDQPLRAIERRALNPCQRLPRFDAAQDRHQ